MTSPRKNQKNRPGYRHCTRCKEEFPIDSFYRNKSDAQGRSHICPPCSTKHVREWSLANWDKHREYLDKKRAEYIKRNTAIVKTALNNSVCARCGDPKPLQFIQEGHRQRFFDPVMSAAKRAKSAALVQEAIKTSIPVCITCVVT